MALHMGRYRALLAQGKHPKGTYLTPQSSGGAYNSTVPTERYEMTKQAIRRHIAKYGNNLRTELGISTHTPTPNIDGVCSLI